MTEHIFVVQLAIASEHEARFNEVYNTDHLTHMIQVPGAINCGRYRLQWSDNTDMQQYIAIYEISDPTAPQTAAWKQQAGKGAWPVEIRHLTQMRRNGVYRRISQAAPNSGKVPANGTSLTDTIYFLLQGIPPALEGRFNELYDGDHIPFMLKTPGVQGCTRYKLAYSDSGDIPDYLAIYAIDDAELPRTPAWKVQTNKGKWPMEMRPNFTARRNGSFRQIGYFEPKR